MIGVGSAYIRCGFMDEPGASRPAVGGSMSPECVILLSSCMASGYGVPLGVKGTRKLGIVLL